MAGNNPSVANNVDPNFLPNDDISVAKRLAEHYRAQGMDPNMAFDHPDEAMLDFGINGLKDHL